MSEAGKVVHVLSGQPYDVYVGRANRRHRLEASIWANPGVIGKHGPRQEVLKSYEEWMFHMLAICEPPYYPSIKDLYGKTLACWCAPKDGHLTEDDSLTCHGQILLRFARENVIGSSEGVRA